MLNYIFKYLLLICFIGIVSCSNNLDKNLGNGFYYYQESRNNFIVLFCTNQGFLECNSGFEIIPSNILKLNYNEDFLLAKTNSDDSYSYWIVDKSGVAKESSTKGFVFAFKDESEFKRKVDSLGIELELKQIEDIK